jgi:hemerythrin-like metal-binding protein
MAKIQWQTVFETKVPSIDMQHKRLVAMINQLEDAVDSGKGAVNEEIGSVLVQLVEYTQYHFSEEENIQREIGFSEAVRHAEYHRMFVEEIKETLMRLKDGGSINVYELMNFLRDWLLNHILTEDRKIGIEYAQRGARHTSPLVASSAKG